MGDVQLGWDMSGGVVTLPAQRRLQGTYILGKNGTGKSSLLINLIKQDLDAGHGVAVLDPHGDLIIDTLALLPRERTGDVVLLDLQDTAYPFALNLFACSDPTDPMEVAQTAELVTAVFKRVWGEAIGPRSQDVLENTVYALVANPGSTLDDVPRFLTHPALRERMLKRVNNDVVQDYWTHEFNSLKPGQQQQIVSPLLNKVRAFLRHPVLREIVRQDAAPDVGEILRNRQILLVRLNHRMEEATSLLGTLITLRLLHAALGRAQESTRLPFFLYADEFQRFATPDFGVLLQEARKFGIGTVLAHQLRSQLDRELRSFVLGAGTVVCFQLTAEDEREMEREFPPELPPVSDVVDTFIAGPEGCLDWLLTHQHPDPHVSRQVETIRQYLAFNRIHNRSAPDFAAHWEPVSRKRDPLSPRQFIVEEDEVVDSAPLSEQEIIAFLRYRLFRAVVLSQSPHEAELPIWYFAEGDTAEGRQRMQTALRELAMLLQEEFQRFLSGAPRVGKERSPLSHLPLLHARVRLDRGNGTEAVQIRIRHALALGLRKAVADALAGIDPPDPVGDHALQVRRASRERVASPLPPADPPAFAVADEELLYYDEYDEEPDPDLPPPFLTPRGG